MRRPHLVLDYLAVVRRARCIAAHALDFVVNAGRTDGAYRPTTLGMVCTIKALELLAEA